MRLSKRMRDVLKAADLDRGEINDVPIATMYGLENRGLITSDWSRIQQITYSGSFPIYHHVRLTATGYRAARSLNEIGPRI